eukprot:scaffold58190_cov64-Phaeocystis_antarctica.AAC.5
MLGIAVRHAPPAHEPFDLGSDELKLSPSAKNPKNKNNEDKTMVTSRMSFASMGCTLSSIKNRPELIGMRNHVYGQRMGSKTRKMPPKSPPIVLSSQVQSIVHPRPSSTRLIRACKRAAVIVASRSRLSAAAGSVSLVVVARAVRQRPRMQATLQLISHGKSARKAVARMAGTNCGPCVNPHDGIGGRCNGPGRLAQAAQPFRCALEVAVVVTRHLEQFSRREDAAIAYGTAVARAAVASCRRH